MAFHLLLASLLMTASLASAQSAIRIDPDQPALACGLSGARVRGPALAVPVRKRGVEDEAVAQVLRAEYDVDNWTGALTRSALWQGAAAGFSMSPVQWDAAKLLDAQAPALRRIYTLSAGGATVPLLWPQLSASQQEALNQSPEPPLRLDGLGEARLDYLRGERSREGNPFRRRTSLLGASVRTMPLYLAEAAERADIDGYAAYRRMTLTRTPAVYLGANDGMLHAFDFNTGRELFAYVPASLFPALNLLTSPGFAPRAYVDGPLAAGDAIVAGSWRTVLLAALGGGGPGLFALDVTDPARFEEGRGALWEFTAADDPAMGELVIQPQLARLQTGQRKGAPYYRDFAVTGNGLNSAGNGALFLLALDKPPDAPWTLGSNYYRLDLPETGPGMNALGSPALVGDEHRVRHIYAGDLRGNLWRFDFTTSAPWKSRASQRPLFVARGPDGQRQPILQTPRIAFAANGGYLILFGTGLLLSRADRVQDGSQSFYAIFDDPDRAADGPPLTRDDLLLRRLDGADGAADFTVSGRMQTIGPGGPQGWVLDFRDAGERSLSSAVLRDGAVLFTTTVPGAGPCDPSTSRNYQLSVLAGLPAESDERTARQVTDFLPTPPFLPPPTQTVRKQAAGRIILTRSTHAVQFGASATEPAAVLPVRTERRAGRLSWREIANWRELHRAAARPP